jgi:hypothetical protein
VLAIGVYFLNHTQQVRADKAAHVEKERTQVAADRQAALEREKREDSQREAALDAYIGRMSELLLHEKLGRSVDEESYEVRKIARLLTVTILPRLDGKRKGSVLLSTGARRPIPFMGSG